MKRSAPLERRTPLRRQTRVRPVNTRRRRQRFELAFGERGEHVRAMPCLLAGKASCEGRTEAAHVRSRGAGGTRRDLVPLCSGHHEQQHRWGLPDFQRRHQIDLRAEAQRIAADLDSRGVP